MAIPNREFDSDLYTAVKSIKRGTSLHDVVAAFICAVLERNHGNRTWTYQEIKMGLRTLRNHIHYIEALGYTVPKYDKDKCLAAKQSA